MLDAVKLATIQGRLISRYQVFWPSGEKKEGIETGYAEKFEKEMFYRLYVTEPRKRDLFIMPSIGGMRAAFKVFAPIRNSKGEFLNWLPVGEADWSYDRKGIYIRASHPESKYLIVLEPANFPYWKIDARK